MFRLIANDLRPGTGSSHNKRAAFAANYTFLAINGAALTADSGAAYDFISGLYEKGAFSFDNLVPWLRINVKVGPPRPSSRVG